MARIFTSQNDLENLDKAVENLAKEVENLANEVENLAKYFWPDSLTQKMMYWI